MKVKNPWHEELKVEASSLEEVYELSIKAGLLAPSTHNSQPWEVKLQDNKVELFDIDRNIRHADPENFYKWISIGGFIENFSVCSAHYGYETQVEITNAKINLVNKQSNDAKTDLLNEVNRRYSEKRVFESRKMNGNTLNELSKSRGVTFISNDREIINNLATLQYEASRKYKNNKYFARELSSWMKLRSKHKDGMNSRSSGLTRPKLAIGKFALKVSPKVLDKMALKYKNLVACSSAVGFISAGKKDKLSLIESGRILENLSLLASHHGLSLTPLAAIIEDRSSVEVLKSLQKNSSDSPVIFFRISDTKKPVYHTTRKPYKIITRS